MAVALEASCRPENNGHRALLAKRAGRPVKLILSREETYLVVGNRHPATAAQGRGEKGWTLTGARFWARRNRGRLSGGGISLVRLAVRDLYRCPNVRTESTDVYVMRDASPRAAGHLRVPGPGTNDGCLAGALKMDPVELR